MFSDKSFDYVITNATIHHVDLPHKAITELYRISIKGTLIIESNDSLTLRLASKAKLAEDAGQFDMKEYLMKEFRKMIEKHETSKVSGMRITVPGSHGIR